jgi:hypothetical protein
MIDFFKDSLGKIFDSIDDELISQTHDATLDYFVDAVEEAGDDMDCLTFHIFDFVGNLTGHELTKKEFPNLYEFVDYKLTSYNRYQTYLPKLAHELAIRLVCAYYHTKHNYDDKL